MNQPRWRCAQVLGGPAAVSGLKRQLTVELASRQPRSAVNESQSWPRSCRIPVQATEVVLPPRRSERQRSLAVQFACRFRAGSNGHPCRLQALATAMHPPLRRLGFDHQLGQSARSAKGLQHRE